MERTGRLPGKMGYDSLPLHSYESTPTLSPGMTVSSAEPSPAFFRSPSSSPPLEKPIARGDVTAVVPRRKRYHWGWELFCLLTSFCAIVATAVLLWHFDGKPIPEWSGRSTGISINSLLSILSTMSRASLLVPLDEALGQLMWIGFAESEKRLVEAEIFNQATRGPWGAARLMWRRRGRGLASLACVILLLSVGLGTAQQQLISYPARNFITPDPSGNIKVATMQSTYDSYQLMAASPQDSSPQPALDFNVSAALFSALSRGDRPAPPFTCVSGDCTYPQFVTIGVCASCADNSTDVTRVCDSAQGVCHAQFGQLTATCWNASSAAQAAYSTIINQTTAETSNALNATDPGVMTTVFTLRSDMSVWPPRHSASTCRLNWCLKTVDARVANATYAETIGLTSAAGRVEADGSVVLVHGDAQNFRVSRPAQQAFRTLTTLLTGWSKTAARDGAWIHSSPLFSGFAGFPAANATGFADADLDEAARPSPFKALARSMSDAIRRDLVVAGSRVEKKTIVSVRRWWLAYPIALWVLSAVLLACTMVKARRSEATVGSWGSSSLALLLWGVDQRTRAAVGAWSARDMERTAATVKAKLVQEDGGWRLRAVRGTGLA